MPGSRVPLVRAAVTNCSCSTRLARMRVSRAMTAAMASPIAKIAEPSEAPCTATTSIASRRTGKAMTTSSVAERVSSTQGRARAAASPTSGADVPANSDRAGAHDERDPGPDHELRQQVAPEPVGAEQVRAARPLEAAAADVRERVGQPDERDERGDDDETGEDQPDHERGMPAATGCRDRRGGVDLLLGHARGCCAGLIDSPRRSCAGAGR